MSTEPTKALTDEEKHCLRGVLARDEPTLVLMHGAGADRTLSFYAMNTRLEARVPYPDDGRPR